MDGCTHHVSNLAVGPPGSRSVGRAPRRRLAFRQSLPRPILTYVKSKCLTHHLQRHICNVISASGDFPPAIEGSGLLVKGNMRTVPALFLMRRKFTFFSRRTQFSDGLCSVRIQGL